MDSMISEPPSAEAEGFELRLKAGSVGPPGRLNLRDIHDTTIRVHQNLIELLSATFRNVLTPTSLFPQYLSSDHGNSRRLEGEGFPDPRGRL
jgi:hypothetical protein